MPEVQQALKLMGLSGAAAYAAGLSEKDGKPEGLVHISMGAADAYDLARWVERHITAEEAAALRDHPEAKE
ncbi:hypothetical protein V7793_05140 [Streptomyces sp. KLMMK]|uniref:hypothetical protein n=1 Tax=Streptomyces sp. KLMMK TaxID=3109353 RepID=UPI0030008563